MKICSRCGKEFDTDSWRCPACAFQPPQEYGLYLLAPELSDEGEGFSPALFEQLFELERLNFWFRSRNELIAWGLGRWFPAAGRFLEIGCGTGFVLSELERRFPSTDFWGSELHASGLSFARKRVARSTLWQMDARNIPLREEMDVIGAFDVLEHIEDDERVLAQMAGALRPEGGIMVTVPQHPALWSEADELARHQRRYSAVELRGKIEAAGFTIELTTSFVSFLLPAMALSRALMRPGRLTRDPLDDLRLPGALNWVFDKVQRFELSLIRAGLRLPAGGSLFVIARKNR
jgi:SAM-dependent methyltransferase